MSQSKQELIEEAVDEVLDRVSDEYDVPAEEAKGHLTDYYEHSVTGEEAINSTIAKVAQSRNVSRQELTSETSLGSLTDLTNDTWGDTRAVVVDLWETKSDSVKQKGLVNDGEVTRQFVTWSGGTEDIPMLEEGETYIFKSVVGNEDENGDNIQIQINRSSSVTESDEEIESSGGGGATTEFTGSLLDTQGASGLVWRDPESGQVIDSNDGDVEHDLRLILAIDDGETVYRAFFGRELTEELTGITLDEAQDIAMEAMDREAVVEEMLGDLLGRYMTIRGTERDGYIFVDEYEWEEGDVNVDELLMKARSIA